MSPAAIILLCCFGAFAASLVGSGALLWALWRASDARAAAYERATGDE